jgi:hypothetical protein
MPLGVIDLKQCAQLWRSSSACGSPRECLWCVRHLTQISVSPAYRDIAPRLWRASLAHGGYQWISIPLRHTTLLQRAFMAVAPVTSCWPPRPSRPYCLRFFFREHGPISAPALLSRRPRSLRRLLMPSPRSIRPVPRHPTRRMVRASSAFSNTIGIPTHQVACRDSTLGRARSNTNKTRHDYGSALSNGLDRLFWQHIWRSQNRVELLFTCLACSASTRARADQQSPERLRHRRARRNARTQGDGVQQNFSRPGCETGPFDLQESMRVKLL